MLPSRNFVPARPTWQESTAAYLRRLWRIVVYVVLPGAAILAALWWWIGS